MNTTRPYWLIAAVVTSMVAFTISAQSPLGLLLVGAYALALIIPTKMPRDSANIWGLRLMVYALGAVLGRAAAAAMQYQYQYYDARGLLTLGLIMGGELVLQTLRESPRGLRYDPTIVLLSGLLFLIACNTLDGHIFLLAPIYVFTLVMAMNQSRPGARTSVMAMATRVGLVAIAVSMGLGLHNTLWSNRSNIMSLGARLLSSGDYQNQAGDADMGENPEMGTSFAQGASTSRLMRITGNLEERHLRGAAFDLYRKGTWGPKISARDITPADQSVTKENVGEGVSGDSRTDTDVSVTLLRPSNQVLYAPLNIYAIASPDSNFDWSRAAGPIKTDNENVPFKYAWINSKQTVDGVELTQGPLCVAPTDRQRERLLVVPDEIDPRVKELALDVTLEAPTQPEKIAAIVQYLMNTHAYSLDFARGSGDPVSEFLLSKKSAHCQYFAAGAVMMMRSVGIPARYASGFYAHETQDDGTIIVRGRDAHAWAEAYVDGVGWVNVDATPADGRADPAANPLPFYQKVLEDFTDWFGRVRAWFSRLTTVQILAMMSVVLLIWGAERYRQSWRRRRVAARAALVPPELAPLARRFERALAKRGIVLSPGQPWSEALPPAWEREARWVELYNRLRFARRDDDEVRRLAAELEALEREKTKAEP